MYLLKCTCVCQDCSSCWRHMMKRQKESLFFWSRASKYKILWNWPQGSLRCSREFLGKWISLWYPTTFSCAGESIPGRKIQRVQGSQSDKEYCKWQSGKKDAHTWNAEWESYAVWGSTCRQEPDYTGFGVEFQVLRCYSKSNVKLLKYFKWERRFVSSKETLLLELWI